MFFPGPLGCRVMLQALIEQARKIEWKQTGELLEGKIEAGNPEMYDFL